MASLCSIAAQPATESEKLVSFASRQWHAHVHPGIDFAHDFGAPHGLGACALQDIEKGTLLLRMPIDAVIGLEFPRQHDSFAAFASLPTRTSACQHSAAYNATLALLKEKKAPALETTVLLLLHEVGQGQRSNYAHYIALLPRKFPTSLLSFTEVECKALQGTSIGVCTDKLKASLKTTFQKHVLPLMEAHTDLWPQKLCNFDSFEWATSVVTSRAFNCGLTGPYLIPIADMLNHSSLHAHTNLETDVENRCFEMWTTRPVHKHEHIFQSYGCLSSAQLLRGYGFVEESFLSNPYDSCIVEQADFLEALLQFGDSDSVKKRRRIDQQKDQSIMPAVSSHPLKRQLLQRAQLLARDGLFCDGRIHFEKNVIADDRFLTVCLLLGLFSEEEFLDYRYHCPSGSVLTVRTSADEDLLNQVEKVDGLWVLAISTELHIDLLIIVQHVVGSALARFPLSLDQDKQELASSGLSLNLVNALRLRIAERSALHAVFEQVQAAVLQERPQGDTGLRYFLGDGGRPRILFS